MFSLRDFPRVEPLVNLQHPRDMKPAKSRRGTLYIEQHCKAQVAFLTILCACSIEEYHQLDIILVKKCHPCRVTRLVRRLHAVFSCLALSPLFFL